ncbi:MAG: hypothetical protein WCL56_11600 [Sediminibacterium sp.]
MNFIPTSETAKREVLEFAIKEIRVYGVDILLVDIKSFNWDCNDDDWITEAEAQGSVWSLTGFQEAYNTSNIKNTDTLIIKIF